MSEETGKRGPGRPKAKINSKDVYKLASMGCTLNEIADFHDVDVNTIRRRFKTHLIKGKANLKLRLRKAQLEKAIDLHDSTMLIWLGKQMLNQTDNGTFEEDELIDDVEYELDNGE